MANALMLQGTGSDVGKTVLVAGLCRALSNRGLSVLPFKPQNMSNNAAATDDGGEIGRAQWLQALACGAMPSVHMNPVLLKPQSETGSQVVVHGKVRGTAKGRDYQKLKATLLDAVLHSYHHLQAQCDFVLVEGAGSPAEINLRAGDIANMGFATAARVPVVLVGDIDRGGVIASLVGTHTILPDADKAMIVGFLINKFRGDVSLFDDGLTAVTDFTAWPSFGVVPHLPMVSRLPAEDSVALERIVNRDTSAKLKVAVPVTGRIANYDDLDPLVAEADVDVVFVRDGEPWPVRADIIVLAGSKSTIADLEVIRRNGWDDAIIAHAKRGGAVFGICGGYQMLGTSIADPHGLEGPAQTVAGLGLLQVETVMQQAKTVRNTQAQSVAFSTPLQGYEIHLGETQGSDCDRAFAVVDGRAEGATSANGTVTGTYLHGVFSSGPFRRAWLGQFGATSDGKDQRERVLQALDELADALEAKLDIDAMLRAAHTFV